MVWWQVLLTVTAAVIALVLFVPWYFDVSLSIGRASALIRVLFIRLDIGGLVSKGKGKKAAKKEDEPEKPEKKPKDDRSAAEKLNSLLDTLDMLMRPALRAANLLRRRLYVPELRFRLDFALDDPAETAMNYGRVCAFIFPLFGGFCSLVRVREPSVAVRPVFSGGGIECDFFMTVRLRIFDLVCAGAVFGFGVLMNRLKKRFCRGDRVPEAEAAVK